MGAGQSDLYKGTYGDNAKNIPDELQFKNKLPVKDAQLKHIFRDRPGHFSDTPQNRKLLEELANDLSAHAGKDIRGNDWNIRDLDDGSQIWVQSQNGIIQNGGINRPPRAWDEYTGLSRNIMESRGDYK